MACFEICEASPLYGFSSWVESTAIETVPPLSSKALTTLTSKLGRLDTERLDFCQQWAKRVGPVAAVVKDERHRPREVLGAHRALITQADAVLANAEAHRFSLALHRKARTRSLKLR